jgi:hypothetical protein
MTMLFFSPSLSSNHVWQACSSPTHRASSAAPRGLAATSLSVDTSCCVRAEATGTCACTSCGHPRPNAGEHAAQSAAAAGGSARGDGEAAAGPAARGARAAPATPSAEARATHRVCDLSHVVDGPGRLGEALFRDHDCAAQWLLNHATGGIESARKRASRAARARARAAPATHPGGHHKQHHRRARCRSHGREPRLRHLFHGRSEVSNGMSLGHGL